MRTEAYEHVHAKLRRVGRDYFEGLADSDFVGLTEGERAEVKHTLQQRSRQGDGVALDALKYLLSSRDLLEFADSLLQEKDRSDLLSAQLATIVYEVTSGREALNQLLAVLRSADASGRRWILNKISVSAMSDTDRK